MKKFFTAILLVLVMTISCVPALAAEADTATAGGEITAEVTPRAQNGLYYRENLWWIENHDAIVDPADGRSLRLWLNNSSKCIVTVWKESSSGLNSWTLLSSTQYEAGERDVQLLSSCGSGRYKVRLNGGSTGCTASFLIYDKD